MSDDNNNTGKSGEGQGRRKRFGPGAERRRFEVAVKGGSASPEIGKRGSGKSDAVRDVAGSGASPGASPGATPGVTSPASQRMAKPDAAPKGAPARKPQKSFAPRRDHGPRPAKPGLAARLLAVDVVEAVLSGQILDVVLEWQSVSVQLDEMAMRDRALVRALATTALRRRGEIGDALDRCIIKPLPKEANRLHAILMVAVAQLLYMDVPDHAAVSLAMDSLDRDKTLGVWKSLANAVMRRIAGNKAEFMAVADKAALALPRWIAERWAEAYGKDQLQAMAGALLQEPALDLTVKSDAAGWAERLGGFVLPTGSVRLVPHGPVPDMPGFEDGGWWVQDAAAALPARLLGDVTGKAIADLCAAPGGKTAQLALAGADVTALDQNPRRLQRVKDNLARLSLDARLVEADAATWSGSAFDGILLDAPCTATGTLRRHPDVALHRTIKDVIEMAGVQRRLLDHAIRLLKPGALLVYSTCSLEPEEGPEQIRRLLQIGAPVEVVPITAQEVGGLGDWVTREGYLRTLPHHLPHEDPRLAGVDGFFAARLRRLG